MTDPTVEELSALVGDDVEFWLSNPFAAPGDIAAKVCRWVTDALAAERTAREASEAREGNERVQAGWEKARADKAERELADLRAHIEALVARWHHYGRTAPSAYESHWHGCADSLLALLPATVQNEENDMPKTYHPDLFCKGHEQEPEVFCADCEERGVSTRMVVDTDFGGHLCPVCEPETVALLGSPEREAALSPTDPTKEN